MITVQKKTMEDFMGLYIDFWQFLYLPSELRIKKKEREFMLHTLALNAKGYDISSTEYVKEMVSRLGLKTNNEVYNYRSRLKSKGFLVDAPGNRVELPKSLNVKEVPKETYFRFKAICEEPTSLKNQKPVREINKINDLTRVERKPKRPKLPNYQPTVQTEVELPIKREESGMDPLKEASQAAVVMAKQKYEGYVSQAPEFRRDEGYASDKYQDLNRQRDVEKLPPMLEDDQQAPVSSPMEGSPTPKKNIIQLDD